MTCQGADGSPPKATSAGSSSTPGMDKSKEHLEDVKKYMQKQEQDMKQRQVEYEKALKEANTALHSKMVNMEASLRKEMHEKIAKDFEPSARQAAVGKAIKDFNEGKTSKTAEKLDDKKQKAKK